MARNSPAARTGASTTMPAHTAAGRFYCERALNLKEAQTKEPPGNAQLFRLARRDLFLKQEWTLLSSTVSKK
ncbi:MAG: hypothetical protein BCS36_08425 [Desulfovibrio sp. MES5]|nr:MAG: hypothetical protein BCS36_08425 [Desulfovibrio sp. MES5]